MRKTLSFSPNVHVCVCSLVMALLPHSAIPFWSISLLRSLAVGGFKLCVRNIIMCIHMHVTFGIARRSHHERATSLSLFIIAASKFVDCTIFCILQKVITRYPQLRVSEMTQSCKKTWIGVRTSRRVGTDEIFGWNDESKMRVYTSLPLKRKGIHLIGWYNKHNVSLALPLALSHISHMMHYPWR